MTSSPLLLSRNQIDDDAWNQCIDFALQKVVYAYSWYLDTVSSQWEALVWPSADAFEVVMPLPFKTKWGLKKLQQPFFCQFLGLFSRGEIDRVLFEAFIQALNRQYRYISVYNFNPFNTSQLQTALSSQAGRLHSRVLTTHWLPLDRTLEEIYSSYNKDRKQNLKESEAHGWEIDRSDTVSPLIEIFKRYHAGRIPGGVNDSAYNLLTRLSKMLFDRGLASVTYAKQNESIEAGVMVIKCHQYHIYIFNAATTTGRNGNARSFLLHNYFGCMAGKPGDVFDFESPEETSIAGFYKSFGSIEKSYVSLRKNGLPFPFKQIQNWRTQR